MEKIKPKNKEGSQKPMEKESLGIILPSLPDDRPETLSQFSENFAEQIENLRNLMSHKNLEIEIGKSQETSVRTLKIYRKDNGELMFFSDMDDVIDVVLGELGFR